jgi:hypothetical protein
LRGLKTRIDLDTVPGQVFYDASRKPTFGGVDGVVFVADSQRERMDADLEGLDNLCPISRSAVAFPRLGVAKQVLVELKKGGRGQSPPRATVKILRSKNPASKKQMGCHS